MTLTIEDGLSAPLLQAAEMTRHHFIELGRA